jgi:hypothetical protein
MRDDVAFLLRAVFGLTDFAVGALFLWGSAVSVSRTYGVGDWLFLVSLIVLGTTLWISVYLVIAGHPLLAKVRAGVYGFLIAALALDRLRLALGGQEADYRGAGFSILWAVAIFAFGLGGSIVWTLLCKRGSAAGTKTS